jgi:hypothetical protein
MVGVNLATNARTCNSKACFRAGDVVIIDFAMCTAQPSAAPTERTTCVVWETVLKDSENILQKFTDDIEGQETQC